MPNDAGLTLVEMIVVLAIIALVAALIVPNVIGRPDQARVTTAGTDLKTIGAALKMYRLDNGDYPTTAQGLKALVEKPTASPVPSNWAAGRLSAADAGRSVGQPVRLHRARARRLRAQVASARTARRAAKASTRISWRGGDGARRRRDACLRRRGMTLVEMLIVLAIIGIASGGVALAIGVGHARAVDRERGAAVRDPARGGGRRCDDGRPDGRADRRRQRLWLRQGRVGRGDPEGLAQARLPQPARRASR